MRPLNVHRIEAMSERPIREMGELEIYGALAYITTLVNDFLEEVDGTRPYTLEDIDNNTYYCNKKLEISCGGYTILDENGKYIQLDSLFMLDNCYFDIFGYAQEFNIDTCEGEGEMFIVRI